jgi:FtsP/CotA-like multicopper oxidase with cupredoxin domain
VKTRFFHVESTNRCILEANQLWAVWNLNAAGPEENGAVAIATSMKNMKKLSRRQLLDGSIGIGAFLLTAGAVRAEDPMQSTLRIKLINDLPPNRDWLPADISQPHRFNNTNFHFHGSHASPSGIADNVMRSMAPGHIYDIEIKLPEDHTKGTCWYHPHHHGSADIQMSSGMVGTVVIEGDFADVPEPPPASACWC